MGEINFHSICRICLKDSGFHSDIYNERLGDGSLILELINDLLQLDVELDNPRLPKFLCSNCYNKVTEFELFKRFAHESRAVLLCMEESNASENPLEKYSHHSKLLAKCSSTKITIHSKSVEIEEQHDKLTENFDVGKVYCEPHLDGSLSDDIVREVSKEINKSIGTFEDAISDSNELEKDSEIINEKISDSKVHICDLCGQVFITNLLLVGHHKRDHPGLKAYKCNICEKFLSSNSNRNSHVRAHSGHKPYKCDVCEKKFLLLRQLREHKNSHYTIPINSHLCSKKPSKQEIHRNIHHLSSGSPAHQRSNEVETPFKCNTCYKCYSKKQTLTKHMWKHSGEQPFKCDVCDKKFVDSYHFRRHQMIHTGYRPFKCHICKRGFIEKCNLLVHMKSHKVGLSFKCGICGKSFLYRTSLNSHLMVHAKKLPLT